MPTKTVVTPSQRESKTWTVVGRRYFRENNTTPDATTPENPITPAAQPAATPAEQPDKGNDGEKKSRIKQLSDEAAKNRVELKTVKGELSTIKQQLESERQERIKAMREAAAAKHGLPGELAARLTGEDKAAIEADAEALAKILPSPPAPLPQGEGSKGGKAPSPANGGGGGTKLTAEAMRNMTPQEIMAKWDEVQAALRGK